MPAVIEIRCAGAFGGNHGRAERGLRSALLAESIALVRLFQPLQHQSKCKVRKVCYRMD